MNKIILGKYIPGDSLIHRLDPRTKLLICLAFITLIFFANHLGNYLLLGGYVLLGVFLSKIPFNFFIRGLRPLLFLIIFTTSFQIFFTQSDHVLWQWGWITISKEGLWQALFILLRFILIIFMSTLLTLTTQPLSIADGLESLLTPLKKVHFPVHEMALILSIALRFVPTLMEETEKIMNAQRARGVDFGVGNIKDQVLAIVPLLIPLFISSIKRAEELAIAMTARGYQSGEGRTRYRVIAYQPIDIYAGLCFIGLMIVVILLR